MITIKSLEHGIAAVAHDIVVGARATAAVLTKINAVAQKDAPAVEALSGLIDPRAAAIERIGVALLGQSVPVVASFAGEVANDAQAPSVPLTAELVADLKALIAAMPSEIATVKASVAAAAKG